MTSGGVGVGVSRSQSKDSSTGGGESGSTNNNSSKKKKASSSSPSSSISMKKSSLSTSSSTGSSSNATKNKRTLGEKLAASSSHPAVTIVSDEATGSVTMTPAPGQMEASLYSSGASVAGASLAAASVQSAPAAATMSLNHATDAEKISSAASALTFASSASTGPLGEHAVRHGSARSLGASMPPTRKYGMASSSGMRSEMTLGKGMRGGAVSSSVNAASGIRGNYPPVVQGTQRPRPPPYLSGKPSSHRRGPSYGVAVQSSQAAAAASAAAAAGGGTNILPLLTPPQHVRTMAGAVASPAAAAAVNSVAGEEDEDDDDNNTTATSYAIAPSLSHAGDDPTTTPTINEGTPAFEAIQVIANLKVTKMGKLWRRLQGPQMATRIRSYASLTAPTDLKRGKPPRIPDLSSILGPDGEVIVGDTGVEEEGFEVQIRQGAAGDGGSVAGLSAAGLSAAGLSAGGGDDSVLNPPSYLSEMEATEGDGNGEEAELTTSRSIPTGDESLGPSGSASISASPSVPSSNSRSTRSVERSDSQRRARFSSHVLVHEGDHDAQPEENGAEQAESNSLSSNLNTSSTDTNSLKEKRARNTVKKPIDRPDVEKGNGGVRPSMAQLKKRRSMTDVHRITRKSGAAHRRSSDSRVEIGRGLINDPDEAPPKRPRPHGTKKWTRRSRKSKSNSSERKSYVKGKVIDRQHELYALSIAVMLGLRTSICMTNGSMDSVPGFKDGEDETKESSRSESSSKNIAEIHADCARLGHRWLESDDFMAVEKYEFRPKGGPNTPPHQLSHTFKFKDYSPLAFAYLRRLFGINEYEFLSSVCGNANFIEFISNAKSGQFFFYSSDGKYMIKTMTNAESKFLRRILPHYFRHCAEYPDTVITKFLGMYRVKLYHLRRNVKFVIMNSVFDTDKFLSSFFDVKGSTIGREARPGEDVKKDNDVREFLPQGGFVLPKDVQERMRAQLLADCAFFKRMKIMDYSMLIGVHRIPPQKKDEKKISSEGRRDAFDKDRNKAPQLSENLSVSSMTSYDIAKEAQNFFVLHNEGVGGENQVPVANAGGSVSPSNKPVTRAESLRSNSSSDKAGRASVETKQPILEEEPAKRLSFVSTGSGSVNSSTPKGSEGKKRSGRDPRQMPGLHFPGGEFGQQSLDGLEEVLSVGTMEPFFEEEDESSYLDGTGPDSSDANMSLSQRLQALPGTPNRGLPPSRPSLSNFHVVGGVVLPANLTGSNIAEGLDMGDAGSEDGTVTTARRQRKIQALELNKELATEQMYWPFHRFYNIQGHRRTQPMLCPDDEMAMKSDFKPKLQMNGKKNCGLPTFQHPISNRKDKGLALDVQRYKDVLGSSLAVEEVEGKIFYMGIIDVLQQFNIRKRMEAKYRRMRGGGWADASCVHPNLYADRFVEFFDEYTLRNFRPPEFGEEGPLGEGGDIDDEDGVEEVVFEQESQVGSVGTSSTTRRRRETTRDGALQTIPSFSGAPADSFPTKPQQTSRIKKD